MIELVRAGVGKPDLPVRIDGFSRWRATADVAQNFQDGRVFIIGDAAHLMPPNGGFGGNTGIHDAHNLAWKLAQVIQGHAHPRLLDSYASERKPVARFTVEQAFSRYVARTAPWLAATQTDRAAGARLRHRDRLSVRPRRGACRSAHHARHARLAPASLLAGAQRRRVSTLDLTGRWLLLAGPEGERVVSGGATRPRAGILRPAARRLARRQRSSTDPAGGFSRDGRHHADGAPLVRPDGFVAWRAEHAHAGRMRGRDLARGTGPRAAVANDFLLVGGAGRPAREPASALRA